MPVKIPFQQQWSERRLARNKKREAEATALLVTTSPSSIRNGSAPRAVRRAVRRACNHLAKINPSRVSNWYESGNPFNDGSRSIIAGTLTDARYDQNQMTRRESQRRMRIWEQNSVFVKRGVSVSNQYVIGTHSPVVTSLSSDVEWARRAEEVKREMDNDSGLNGESFFSQLLLGNRRQMVDGNVLFVKTSKPGFVTIRAGTKYETQLPVMKPCWQMVESHRIGTPFSMWQDENSTIFDGVAYKEIVTKLADGSSVKVKVKAAYAVNESGNVFSVDQGYTFVNVEDCYYASVAHRVNEPRGMTDFYVSEPTLALLDDLLKMEMKAQEVQSEIALFITNGAGQEVSPKQSQLLQQLQYKVSTDPSTGKPIVTAADIEKVKALYDKIWPGKKAIGRTGDTMDMMAPSRPSEATLNLWNFLIDSFCTGNDWPRILIFPKSSKGQGTEVRAQIEAANGAFIQKFNLVWKPFIHMDWEFKMGWAIKNDERVKNPPADWKSIDVSHPRSIVVDLGYAAAETISFLEAGILPLHSVAQQFGTTREKIITNSVKDVFDYKLACAKMAENPIYSQFGITVDAGEVRGFLSEAAKNLVGQARLEKETEAEGSDI